MKPTVETVKLAVVRGKIGSMSTLTIAEFLEARIVEDEALASACLTEKALTPYSDERIPPVKPEEWGALVDNYLGGEMGKHCAQHTPTRVIAECAAKRAIIAAHPITHDVVEVSTRIKYGFACETCFKYGDTIEDHGYCDTLRALASVYADHAEYNDGWAL